MEEKLFGLISNGYDGVPLSNEWVCKELPTFMVKELPIDGKFLHTSKVLKEETEPAWSGLTKKGQ